MCTLAASNGIEDLRKACGGHGYLMNSGIASLEGDYKYNATAEGDFVVLLLQTARYLYGARAAARAPEGRRPARRPREGAAALAAGRARSGDTHPVS